MNSDTDFEVDILEDSDGVLQDHEEIDITDENVAPVNTNISVFTVNSNLAQMKKRKETPPIQLTAADSREPDLKRPKISIDLCVPSVTFKDFRGFPQLLRDISELVVNIKEGEAYKALGVTPPRGFLLLGPSGCGKTLLAQATAGQLEVPLISVSGSDLMPCFYGMGSYRMRHVFDLAKQNAPCILFIDKVEVVAQRKGFANKMERQVAEELLECIDGLHEGVNSHVMIIGATTSPESLDPAFRMPGRFDREFLLEIPDKKARKEILDFLTSGMKLQSNISLDDLAEVTPGFVAADLKSLITEASIAAITRLLRVKVKERNVNSEDVDDYLPLLKSAEPILSSDEIENIQIQNDDFNRALKSVQPSTKREGFVNVPLVTWDDIGSLADVRNHLQRSILLPVKYPDEFSSLGITRPSGILLCGPPGCGKTLLAKAIANEANINFISVKGSELLSKYVGESEKAVRQCFLRAKQSQPCIIFFDEVDSFCPKRGEICDGTNISARILNQILTEMDGVEERKGVFLLAATNRPDLLDTAVLRPGRFDKIIFVGLPNSAGRVEILKAITKNGSKPPMPDVDLEVIGNDPLLEGYTGADLAALVKEASIQSLTDFMDGKISQLVVTSKVIMDVASRLRPSISSKDLKFYNKLKTSFGDRTSTVSDKRS